MIFTDVKIDIFRMKNCHTFNIYSKHRFCVLASLSLANMKLHTKWHTVVKIFIVSTLFLICKILPQITL